MTHRLIKLANGMDTDKWYDTKQMSEIMEIERKDVWTAIRVAYYEKHFLKQGADYGPQKYKAKVSFKPYAEEVAEKQIAKEINRRYGLSRKDRDKDVGNGRSYLARFPRPSIHATVQVMSGWRAL